MNEGLYSMETKDFDRTFDLSQVKPYGDAMSSGKIQLSFALPVPKGAEVKEATKLLLKEVGLQNPMVVFSERLTKGSTFFNCYGSCTHTIDYSNIYIPKVKSTALGIEGTNEFVCTHVEHKLVVLGANTGIDIHTVGTDAIMNMRDFVDHYGLECYDMVDAYDLDSQVPNEEPIAKGIEMNADVLPVSQTVARRDIHIEDMAEFTELVGVEGLHGKMIIICDGPRISHELVKELGFDAGFGANAFADDVTSFICQEIVRHRETAEDKLCSTYYS